MKKISVALALIAFLASYTYSLESIPAKWHHELSSTSLVGYKKGEHLIISFIHTGTLGKDAVVKHSLEVKVSAWAKPSTQVLELKDGKTRETLTVTLYEMTTPKEMKADFEHIVFENGVVVLKFCGTTVLTRVS